MSIFSPLIFLQSEIGMTLADTQSTYMIFKEAACSPQHDIHKNYGALTNVIFEQGSSLEQGILLRELVYVITKGKQGILPKVAPMNHD